MSVARDGAVVPLDGYRRRRADAEPSEPPVSSFEDMGVFLSDPDLTVPPVDRIDDVDWSSGDSFGGPLAATELGVPWLDDPSGGLIIPPVPVCEGPADAYGAPVELLARPSRLGILPGINWAGLLSRRPVAERRHTNRRSVAILERMSRFITCSMLAATPFIYGAAPAADKIMELGEVVFKVVDSTTKELPETVPQKLQGPVGEIYNLDLASILP